MTVAWHAAVAEHKRDELAEMGLESVGLKVKVPRKWMKVRTLAREVRTAYELLHPPYFFVYFDGADAEQYALVMRQRGISHILETRPQIPGPIDIGVIRDHEERERAERAGLQSHTGHRRSDLTLRALYVIVRHETFRGRIGTLYATGSGYAYLDCDRCTIRIPEGDIAPATEDMRRAMA